MDEIYPSKSIYVASKTKHAAMWRAYRVVGYPIISTWIDEDETGQTNDFAELWQRIGQEVRSCKKLVLYIEPEDFPLKGALIEVGMALSKGIPVYVVLDNKIELDGCTFRPIGSWIKHPLVRMYDSLEDAMV